MQEHPEHVLKQFEYLISRGQLASRNLKTWRGTVSYSLPAKDLGIIGTSTITFSPATTATQYQLELRDLKFAFNRLFRFYAYKVSLGFFIPEQNIEEFRDGVQKLKEIFAAFKKSTLDKYPAIIVDIRRKYEELAAWVWQNQYKNSGSPPESFVHKFCEDGLQKRHTPEVVEKRFKFFLTYTQPPNDPDSIRDLSVAVYEKVLQSRRGLTYYALKKRRQFLEAKCRGPRQRMAKFFALYKKLVFYDDSQLIVLLNELIDKAIRFPKTTNEEFAEMLRKLIRHLLDSQEFQLGIRYDGGQQI